ncbi:MAG: membrane dipeptidase [Gemmataceae bacterium]|nr:membrane dipeptidase [Gemmataceae bacterium]
MPYPLIFDSHLDLAWNAIDWNRDLKLTVHDIRRREIDARMNGKGRGEGTVSFPDLRRGNVGLFIATLLARLHRPGMVPAFSRYDHMDMAYAATMGQLHYYKALEEEGYLRWVKDRAGLDAHVKAWLEGDTSKQPLGFILSMEGADPVLSVKQLQHWWDAGLRIIGPAHYGVSPYAHGTGTEGGWFADGPALLKEMDRLGIILDVTHLSDQCLDECFDLYGGPMLASHHNCRALVPDQRQLPDHHIKKLVARGAVIGAAFDTWMLVPGWERGKTRPEDTGVSIGTVLDHIDRVCQLAGNARHAALGTDLDGGFGKEQSPLDLDTIADLQLIPAMLEKRGYKAADVEGIMWGNWVRFFREAWA